MSRVKEFNQDDVLTKAMNLFWEQGYTNTSMQELVDVMQINRGSIYATFGDKHSLFLRVLEYYHQYLEEQFIDVVTDSKDLRTKLNEVFSFFLKTHDEQQPKGCLIVNSATELAQVDPDVNAIINDYMQQETNLILKILKKATYELMPSISLETLANRLQLALIGIRVSIKLDTKSEILTKIVEDIIDTLPWKTIED
ncbi:TetR/AcrR family transcriptional regulator [Weissella koreensis]|uniref:TetR/AcrR family transcriptional regulator n=1 Tax=Weissella koreensis TaxID=165096 RepID=A0A7H1MLW9_9LACO|nr:TetR/AcrR family transcriptional regulator [Weissella koreensis]AVH75253.1 TetR/AcrR family transcriptional regulator [Weissella koreensis]QGN20477.1 TetR family transcriptional regulator [Weissella koreensis]QNT64455.1 TetR/AcrR family transcriptional regulator [Weissella koreensis]